MRRLFPRLNLWKLADGVIKTIGGQNVEITGSVSVTGNATIGGSVVSGSILANLLSYGITYNQTADSYGRAGLLAGMPVGCTLGDDLLPIQAAMKRCILSDAGVVQYYLDADDGYNRDGVAPSVTGTDDAGAASKLSDAGVFTEAESAYKGRYVHNTTDDTYAMITAKDSDDALSISADIMDVGETFEICTAVLDGTDGQVMVEIPAFYFRYTWSSPIHRWDISLVALDGFTLHPAFTKNGSAVDYRYYGAYEASMYDDSAGAMTAVGSIHSSLYAAGDKMCSVSGQYPKTNETRAEYRAMAEARGTGWHQEDFYLRSAVQLLYLIEYADFDSQAMIGIGRTSLSNGDWVASETWDGTNYGYIGMSGKSNGNGNATGANNDATNLTGGESPAYMSYRGIENWWGGIWKFVDGINVHNSSANGSRAYATNNYDHFADDTDANYTLLTSALSQADGYARQICPIEDGFLPSSVAGGASNTGLADYYYTYYDDNNDSGWRVVHWGGRADDGAGAGAFCARSSYASSSAAAAIGGRLCF